MTIVVEHQEEVLEKMSLVGVDVSAKTLAVIIEQDGERRAVREFANDRVGHGKLITVITKRGRSARVVLYGMMKHDRDFEGEKFYVLGA